MQSFRGIRKNFGIPNFEGDLWDTHARAHAAAVDDPEDDEPVAVHKSFAVPIWALHSSQWIRRFSTEPQFPPGGCGRQGLLAAITAGEPSGGFFSPFDAFPVVLFYLFDSWTQAYFAPLLAAKSVVEPIDLAATPG
jgi:hypothetical protein